MNKLEALERLNEIVEEATGLADEAAGIMQELFPDLYNTGKSYDAFNFTGSWNRYDTTLESLIEEAYEDFGEEEFA